MPKAEGRPMGCSTVKSSSCFELWGSSELGVVSGHGLPTTNLSPPANQEPDRRAASCQLLLGRRGRLLSWFASVRVNTGDTSSFTTHFHMSIGAGHQLFSRWTRNLSTWHRSSDLFIRYSTVWDYTALNELAGPLMRWHSLKLALMSTRNLICWGRSIAWMNLA